MEAAYDKNNSINAFDNDSSHFKFSNTDGGFNISPDMPVSNDSEECQMIPPPTLVKKCYNESNDAHITDESVDVVDNHQRFEDDFGPETDVDAMDETTFIKSPVEPQANDNNNEFSLSNGVKPFTLENKIMQQLSEQNRDFLTDSNPFKNDHFDQYSDDHALLEHTAKASDDRSAEVVDNKIIDALESLAVSNGENEKHELEDGKQEGDLLDIRQQSPDIPDLTEKADYVHEKNLFMFDSAVKPDDTFMQHSDSTLNQAEDQKSSLLEQDTPSLADTRCVDESVCEDSEEEEDEWNYIKGDKKAEAKHNPSAAELFTDSAQPSESQSSELVVEVAHAIVPNLAPEQQLLDFTSEETVQKEEEEEPLSENEKIDETKDDIVETEERIAKTEDTVREALEEQPEDTAVSIEQELADYENNCSTVVSSDVAFSSENSKPVPFDVKLNLETAQNLLFEEASASELVESYTEIDAEHEQSSTEAVVEDEPVTDIVTEEEQSTEVVAEPTSSMNFVEEDSPSTEIVVEEAPVEKQTTEDQSSDSVKETSVDEELERPDSLSFEMASKLNPEAKEFVPVSSPTRSNPTSPVANASSMVPNSFLMLDDDTVVAQSPKKFTSTMDNIDVPAEDDFQHEMNNRPHELEKPSEYVNGNADVSVRSHSPVSETSYQELNLKEAMQADEKLEHDYNDEKQIVSEDSPSDIPNEENILNVLNKEQDPMNMSFYEGRDEALLSNSDELNKVHMLPEVEDEVEEPSNDDTDKVQTDMHELTPTEPVDLLEDKMELTEPESTSQPTCEEELQPKSSLPEGPSAAIFAVASQVVNDVAALVDQMQIESSVVKDADLEQDEELHSEVPVEKPAEITTDDTKLEENRDILISLQLQIDNKPLEEATDIHQQPASPSPNPVESLHAAETEELVSPLVESLQQEVVAENEFITDESVLNVQSPAKSMFSAEAPTESESVLEEPIATQTTESIVIEPVAELVEKSTTPNLLETVTPVLEQVAALHDSQPVVDEFKPVVTETKTATTKPTAKTSTTAKPTASKTTTAKTTKPAAPKVEKKTTTAAKLSAKPATTKISTATKPPTTSTIKKTTTVSSAPSTRTNGAAKPPSSSTVGRSSTVVKALEYNVLAIECSQYTEMLNDNVVQPYHFRQHRRFFLFNFHYAKLEDYIQQLCQLHRASTLHAYEQNSMIATIVFSRHNRVRFNPLWLDNLYERIIVDYQVDEINPLVVNPGRLLLTNAFLYFQPYNNIQTYPVLKIRLKCIKSFLKRRFLLRHVGLEVRWTQGDQERLLYVSFRNQAERDDFYGNVAEQEDFSVVEQIPESITLKWQNGLISNYEYLLYLNSLADRTYQDLTQYPVFPWVISDYSSDWLDLNNPDVYRDLTKPIGALNEERLRRLKERCEEMSDPKFLYGSHYSAPGLVLFYLVRKYPKLMLCLQNGRFDHPDRMFNKVEDVYSNCLNNMADFKELIPEFYDTETKGDFLLNRMKINFGQRFDGTPVNHVILPKWADGCPEKFVAMLREALESDYVSSRLHHWIDLIFGYKQRGEEALKADNLFYYLCYEGSVDLDQIKDLAARHALEVQISEFGQIPKQLFRTPHVSKLLSIDAHLGCPRTLSIDGELRIAMDTQYFSHKDEITSMLIDETTKHIFTTSKDGTFKCYSLVEQRQIRSVQISDMPLSAIRLTNGKSVVLGCWDNSIIIYNLDYGKISQVIAAHDDAVSCLSSVKGSEILVSGSWDCSVKIWNDFHIDSVIGYLPLEDKIVCMDTFHSDCNLRVVIGTSCGELFLWKVSLTRQSLPDVETQEHKLVLQHKDAICVVRFNRNCSLIASCGEDRMFNIVDIETGMVIFKREMPAAIRSLCWAKDDKYLLMGDRSGMMYVWNMLEGMIQKEVRVHSDCIYCIGCTENSQIVTSGKDDRDYCVKIWESNL